MSNKTFCGYDTFEDWLDATCVSLYEKVKDMTIDERLDYLHKTSEPILKEFGIKESRLILCKEIFIDEDNS